MRTQCTATVALLFLWSLQGAAQPAGEEEFPAPVRIAEATRILMPQQISLFGTVEPFRRSEVATEVDGLVEDFPYVEGDRVEGNAVVARLRNRTLQIQRDAALASLRAASADLERLRNGYRPWEIEAARARLAVLEALADQARRDLERNRQLIDEGAATEENVEDAGTDLAAALSRVAEASADLALLVEGFRTEEIAKARAEAEARTADLAWIEDEIAKTHVRVPFTGSVSETLTEVGEWVSEGDPILELIQLDPVLVLVDVPERYLEGLQVGRKAVMRFDALPGDRWEGRVTRVVPQADVAARTFPVKIELPNQDNRIRSGMLARVELELGEPEPVNVVPKDAVVLSSRGNTVFVVEDGRARMIPVEIGRSFNQYIAVTPEIEAGTPVVIRGNERLREGQKVMIEAPSTGGPGRGGPPPG